MSKYILAPGFANIPLRDLPIWVKAFKEEGITSAAEIQKELTLIDDLLTLQKCQSLLNRKRKLRDQLEARISLELGIATPVPTGNKKREKVRSKKTKRKRK